MACAGYQEKLIEAALDSESDAAQDAGFVQHVGACTACRAELERQRALYARIEDGIGAFVNVSVPPAIAARVRQEISASSSRAFAWGNWGWVSAVGLASAAVVLAFVFRFNVAPQPAQNNHTAIASPQTTPAPAIEVLHPAAGAAATVHAVRPRGIAGVHAAASESPELTATAVTAMIGPPHVQVIVPAGQREAVLRLASALQTGNVDVASILAPPPQSLQAADLQIAPLEIKPLDAVEAAGDPISPDNKPSIRN